jgi:C-terminal processing protease CtpA/Prc
MLPCFMKYLYLAVLLLSVSCFNNLKAQDIFNGNFEQLDGKGNLQGWDLSYYQRNKYDIKLDTVIRKQGRYSVSLSSNDKTDNGAIVYTIPKTFRGKHIMLTGHLKTENVTEGFAGIWLRVSGPRGKELAFESMKSQNLSGTNDWREYLISLPYNEQESVSIELGALLIGKGKVWVDSLVLYIDEKPIHEVALSKLGRYKALQDTAFDKSSGLNNIPTNPVSVRRLTSVGQLWGFLKYHHPAIARGDHNWDAGLFRILPAILQSKSDQQVSGLLEKWVDQLGPVVKCDTCSNYVNKKNVAQASEYGNLFIQPVFTQSLRAKLKYILQNTNNPIHYYVSSSGTSSSPSFLHEIEYSDYYPDAGFRLLALYRYWSIIQYFSPNRNLTDKNWNSILPEFIPKVLQAPNARHYVEAMTELIASINDTHGFIGSYILENLHGRFKLPFQAKFIEDQLVVTKYYKDMLDVKSNVQRGDVIMSINGAKVTDLIKKYSSKISGSNTGAILRDLPSLYLLASADSTFNLMIKRGAATRNIAQKGVPRKLIDDAYWQAPEGKKSYRLLNPEIGYVHCGKYMNTELDSIKILFKSTKGIIIDMRGYPIDEMTETLAAWCKPDASAFVKFSEAKYSRPGLFTYSDLQQNGRYQANPYLGKVIVLVNETTQSNAEFVTMAFQSAPNVLVIGSTTSGADGNITSVTLPGGIVTWFSGIGVYYPDGSNAQRSGVKIDRTVRPTIQGVKEGLDEVLQVAKEMIQERAHN